MTDESMRLYNATNRLIRLFEAWRDGIFAIHGVTWIEEPPAVVAARQAIKDFDDARCTSDSFTRPVGHDHP